MNNSTYNPQRIDQFDKTKLNFNAQGVSASPTAGATTNLDYTLADDCLLNGLELIVSGATLGDYLHLQVVDLTGAFSGTPGTILLQPATNWYTPVNADTQFDTVYPAKILTGMTLRVAYHSTGLISPFLAVNYKLHKVLV